MKKLFFLEVLEVGVTVNSFLQLDYSFSIIQQFSIYPGKNNFRKFSQLFNSVFALPLSGDFFFNADYQTCGMSPRSLF